MLIIKNASGGSTKLVNSGKNNANGTSNDHNNDVDLYKLINNDDFPIGTIMLFNGNINTLVEGWFLCDGHNGTPNLNRKFIRCISTPNDANLGKTGGYTDLSIPNHTHVATMSEAPDHTHKLVPNTFNTSQKTAHTHLQPHVSRYDSNRRVCDKCGNSTSGRIMISQGFDNKKTTKTGAHTHKFTWAAKATTSGGGHTHSPKTVQTGASGINKNIPKHTKIFFIMRVS